MSSESLASALARVGSPVELLRNLSFPPSTFPVQPEFTNRHWNVHGSLADLRGVTDGRSGASPDRR